jgi:hypothetical protein
MKKSDLIFKAIKKIYPEILGGYIYSSEEGLIWENTQYPKPEWSKIEELLPAIELEEAKNKKLTKLEAFILTKKTEPFTSHLAPEIIDGSKIGTDVKFYWYVDDIPNSNLTSESVLAKCTMDYVSCNDFAKKTGTDHVNEKTIYNTCIKQKIVPYPTTIIKKDAEGKDKEQAGVVNIFPVAFSLAQHIQSREIQNNILLKTKQIEINACKSAEKVEAIKFEG